MDQTNENGTTGALAIALDNPIRTGHVHAAKKQISAKDKGRQDDICA